MARIVETDNYNGDYPGERFLLWVLPDRNAQEIADAINQTAVETQKRPTRFWKVVADDYKLQPGLEP